MSVSRINLLNLIYDIHCPEVDKKMSKSQMGGRRQKSDRNNIFIVNGIIHDVMDSKKPPVVLLQYYDYSQMFETFNDIYDSGLSWINLEV